MKNLSKINRALAAKKRLLTLVVCSLLAIWTVSASQYTMSGTFKNGGTWKVEKGVLYVDAETIPNSPNTRPAARTNLAGGQSNAWENMSDWWGSSNSIRTIELSSKVKKIGNGAFAGCVNLEKVVFKAGNNNNVEIGDEAFSDCWRLTDFDFSRVTVIGENAFDRCRSLKRIELPVIQSIGRNAFCECASLWLEDGGIVLSGNTIPSGLNNMVVTKNPYGAVSSTDANGKTVRILTLSGWLKVIVPPAKLPSYISTYAKSYTWGLIFLGGDGWKWYFDDTRKGMEKLYIFANYYKPDGIPDFESETDQPWYSFRDKIRWVEIYNVTPYGYTIGKNAFKGSNIYSIDVHNSFISWINVGESAFEGCSRFTRFDQMANARSVGKRAFANTCLTKADLSKAETIGDNAFDGCNINNITFGSISSIGQYAFRGAFANGGEIYVSTSVPTTAGNAFSGAKTVNTILHVGGEHVGGYMTTVPWSSFQLDQSKIFPISGTWGIGYGTWMIDSEGTLIVKGGKSFDQKLPDYANESDQPWYLYRNYIKRVIIEEGLQGIGKNAFATPSEGESQIAEVVVPASVETIGENAFKNNDQIEEVQAEGVKNIGSQAFENCSALEKVKFGKEVSSMGEKVFNNCGIVDVMAVKSATPPAITARTFEGLGRMSANAPAEVKAKYAARRATSATGQKSVSLEVPDEHISKYLAAQYWNLFTFEYIGEHGGIVESDQAYDGLYVLYSDGTMIISASAPTDPQNINTGFTISSSAKLKVKRVEIQGTLEKLGHQFNDCPNLEEVVLSGGINSLNGTFNNCPKLKTINLDNVQYLKSHQQGNKVIPCFGGCVALKEVNIPNVLEIGDNCFKGCTGLTTVALGGEAEVGMEAFSGCTALKRIALGNAKLNGALQAFQGCTALEEMTYNGTRMPAEIFKGCTALHKINLGGSLKDILSEAFANTSIDSIYVQCPTPPEAAANAFSGINLSSIKVIVPDAFDGPYSSAPVWEEMFTYEDEDYAELDFPIHFAIGDNGFGTVDESGNLTINAMGALVDNFRDYVEPYAPYIIGEIRIGNEVSSLPAGTPYRLPFGWVKENGPRAIVLGSGLLELGDYALYNNVWDCDLIVDCYALNPPVMKGANVFNWSRIQNGSQCVATLNVVNDAAVEAAYRADTYWKKFSISSWLTPADAPAECTVTFVDWDGTILQQTTTRPGMMVTPPADPVREGYTFKGWDSQDYTWVVSDLTITATYYDETYTVRFYDWDGTLLSEQQVHYGQAAEAPADPAREGYTFLGWSEDFSDVTIDKYIVAMYHNDHEGIEDIQPDQVPNIKVMIDGVIYILRDGKIYNILGTQVR